MIRLVIPLSFVFGLLSLLTLTAHAIAQESPRLSTLFGSPCQTPCFLNVQLYETRMDAVRQILAESPHITQIDERARMDFIGDEHLFFRWQWRDGGISDGTFGAHHGMVYEAWLSGDLPFGDVWRALGHPEVYSYYATASRRGDLLIYATLFDDANTRLAVRVQCPVTPINFLNGRVLNVEFRRAEILVEATNAPQIDTFHSWLRALRAADPC